LIAGSRRAIAGADGREWLVGVCSSPILAKPDAEAVDYLAKRIGVERAGLLASEQRRVIATGNSWTKSYRLPLRIRLVHAVSWLAVGGCKEVRNVLSRHAKAIGKKVAHGYGIVARWEVERADEDWAWFAPTEHGVLLMRPLPWSEALPADLVGARRDFGACVPPYWHPERYTEIVVPC